MRYYSTKKQSETVSLKDAVLKGLAPDNGLYMPEEIISLPQDFYDTIQDKSFTEISFEVAKAFFGDDVEHDVLKQIIEDTLSFDVPVVPVTQNIFALELFHGPTLAFKDVGGRFMARMSSYFLQKEGHKDVNVLVATSGDTGSAVANGFLGIDGIKVYVLYPKGKVSPIQECQFTTLGQNITALEVSGTFDDCQALVKQAFLDEELNEKLTLTSANSINVARFLPQAFYYFYAYAQLKSIAKADELVVAVPSGNFGNLTAGLIAKRMGLPIKRFIAANNENDVFFKYLNSGVYTERPSVQTIANAMDVGAPSNFVRILDLYHDNLDEIKADISAYRYSDDEIKEVVKSTFTSIGYLLDPHGACAFQALLESLTEEENGLFLETAHPAKFKETVEDIIGYGIAVPAKLKAFMKGERQSLPLLNDFNEFKTYLLNQ